MKSSLIVYLTGEGELPEGFDMLSQCRKMGFTADRVELVGSPQGFLEVNDARLYLLIKGYGNIKLLAAQADQNCLQPVHSAVRLNG